MGKTSFGRAAALALGLALAACQQPEVDQIAQRSLIGMSQKHILACLGQPARRTPVGTEEIWVYPIGQMRTEGGLLALGLNESVSVSPASRACLVKIVIDNHGVGRVYYAGPDDRELPLGQQCLFSVDRCVGP